MKNLLGVIEKQGAEIERFKARKPKASRNSSKPPSSDGPYVSCLTFRPCWTKARGALARRWFRLER